MRYALRNKEKIAQQLGSEYLFKHIIASLKQYFAMASKERIEFDIENCNLYASSSGAQYSVLRINDVADEDCMLEFAIIGQQYDVLRLSFLGRIKG